MIEFNFLNISIFIILVMAISSYFIFKELMNILKKNAIEGLGIIVAMAIGFIIFSPILLITIFTGRNIGKNKK